MNDIDMLLAALLIAVIIWADEMIGGTQAIARRLVAWLDARMPDSERRRR